MVFMVAFFYPHKKGPSRKGITGWAGTDKPLYLIYLLEATTLQPLERAPLGQEILF